MASSRSWSSDPLLPGVNVPGSDMVNRLLPSAIVQHLIVKGKFVQSKALQALVCEVILWYVAVPDTSAGW